MTLTFLEMMEIENDWLDILANHNLYDDSPYPEIKTIFQKIKLSHSWQKAASKLPQSEAFDYDRILFRNKAQAAKANAIKIAQKISPR